MMDGHALPQQEPVDRESFKDDDNVDLYLTSVYRTVNGETSEAKLFSAAKMICKQGKVIFQYNGESYSGDPVAGLPGDDKRSEIILWDARTVILKSHGQTRYTFHLKQGKHTSADFFTDELYIKLEIETGKVFWKLAPQQGNIHLVYCLGNDQGMFSENEVYITVRPSNPDGRLPDIF